MKLKKLVLASASPRRRDLLAGMGFELDIVRSETDEKLLEGETPAESACRLAAEKARDVASRYFAGCDEFILGADTIVVLGGEILGKPRDAADAVSMLYRLSGTTHTVITAFCIINTVREIEIVRHVSTEVTFRKLTWEMIARYIETGEPMDKAGAYAAQGIGAGIIERIEGSYSNVVGLPLCELAMELETLGMEVI